jgi:hypothetical protein
MSARIPNNSTNVGAPPPAPWERQPNETDKQYAACAHKSRQELPDRPRLDDYPPEKMDHRFQGGKSRLAYGSMEVSTHFGRVEAATTTRWPSGWTRRRGRSSSAQIVGPA